MGQTLFEVIEDIKGGLKPDYDDLRYAVLAFSALSTFSSMALAKLAEAEAKHSRPILCSSAKWQLEEHFARMKTALGKSPKEWVGWGNDPDNPAYQSMRQAALKIYENVSSKDSAAEESQ